MDRQLKKKFDETSIESDLLDFLVELSGVSFRYALVGGTACGGYLGHLPRRHTDIDILVDSKSSEMLEVFLKNRGFIERTKNSIVRIFFRDKTYFHIDVFTENLFLANSPDWEVVATFSLLPAFEKRQRVRILSLDQSRWVEVYVIPHEYLFVMKLFPPIEASNTHDLIYLTLLYEHHPRSTANIRSLISNDVQFRSYLHGRLRSYLALVPSCVWFLSLKESQQQFILTAWRSFL